MRLRKCTNLLASFPGPLLHFPHENWNWGYWSGRSVSHLYKTDLHQRVKVIVLGLQGLHLPRLGLHLLLQLGHSSLCILTSLLQVTTNHWKFYKEKKTRRCYWSHVLITAIFELELVLKHIALLPGCHGKPEVAWEGDSPKPSLTLCANLPASVSAYDYSTKLITWVVSNSFFIASFVLSLSAPNYKNTTQKHTANLHRQVNSKWQLLFLPLAMAQVLTGQDCKH